MALSQIFQGYPIGFRVASRMLCRVDAPAGNPRESTRQKATKWLVLDLVKCGRSHREGITTLLGRSVCCYVPPTALYQPIIASPARTGTAEGTDRDRVGLVGLVGLVGCLDGG